jgi:hypothetical protein
MLKMTSKHYGPALESSAIKTLHVLAIFITTLVSTYLFWTRDRLYSDPLVNFVKTNRSSVQIIVQLLSHALALLQLYVLRSLVNFGSRLRLQKYQVSLNRLSLWAALGNAQIDWSLPTLYLTWAALASVCFMVPGAIWAGALSPITTLTLSLSGTIEVPAYSSQSASVWDAEFLTQLDGEDVQNWNEIGSCYAQVYDRRGFIPACPVPALQGSLLLSASSATTVDASPRVHSKLDNSQWTFNGRSYGAGSSVALADPQLPQSISTGALQRYTYFEAGYMPTVDCIKNTTSNITFSLIEETSVDSLVVYVLTGTLPNEAPGTVEHYPVTNQNANYESMLAWAARSLNGRNIIAITSGINNYTELNQTQCEVKFVPTTFEVSVNVTTRSIAVQPTNFLTAEIEPSGHLAANAIDSVNLLSRMSNSLYVSILGNSLQQNILNKQLQLNLSSSGITDDVVTAATEDSFAAMLDDILVAYGASQVVISGDTTSTAVVAYVNAVRIGAPMYQYATFAINALFILAIIFEAIRTRFWHGLLQLDYTSIKSVMVSASAGGPELARAVSERCKYADGQVWLGSPQDPVFTDVKVALVSSRGIPDMPAIGLADSEMHEDDHAASHLIRRKPVPSTDVLEVRPGPFSESTSHVTRGGRSSR